MNNIVNAGIQIVPLTNEESGFPIIDSAIELIADSGLPYEVNAMETVVEGKFSEVNQLLIKLHNHLSGFNTLDYLLNVRFHISNNKDVFAASKTEKFKQ
jgi:uncharacterized protein YqgV (UPF0045/DUF77 family)